MIGYHFTRNVLRDGRPIPAIGEWLEHVGPIVPCLTGLHASEHPYDALRFAMDKWLHKVELEGDLQPHGEPTNKWVGRRRKILATIDAEPVLRAFARWCALQVIDLWDAPPLMRRYLETGDDSIREEAQKVAGPPTWTAASEAAWEAATAAAEAMALAAARAAASATAAAAARAAYEAYEAAEVAAVWDATRQADIWQAPRAAGEAARATQRAKFVEMLEEEFARHSNEGVSSDGL